MTRELQFGTPLAVADVTSGLVRAAPATRAAVPPIEWRKFCINGYPVSAQFQNLLNESTNQAVLHRTRQLFWVPVKPDYISSSGTATRTRWRFAFRTSTYAHAIRAVVALQPPSGSDYNKNSYGKLTIYSDATETTIVGTAYFYYGNAGSGSAVTAGWKYTRTIGQYITGLSANTEYYAKFTDEDGACMMTACVTELNSIASAGGHLPQTINHDSEVLALYRQQVATIQKQIWKNGGGTLLTWSDDALGSFNVVSTASGATVNIFNRTSTTVSASTPGFYLDGRYLTRRSQTTIPCTMKAYGGLTGAPLGSALYLKDSSGSTVASITSFTTTAQWKSATFNLPAAFGKYDLHFSVTPFGGGDALSLKAVSIYPYET